MNQLVGYNLRLARESMGWTQTEAAQAVARQHPAGKPWSKATWSAAEHSVDGQQMRQFTCDDLVAFSRAFKLPVVWWLLPPGSGHAPVEILSTSEPDDAADFGLEALSELTQGRLLSWLTRPSVEVVQRLRGTGFGAYAQYLDGTPTERLLDISDDLRAVIRLIEKATGVVTVEERPDGSTVRRSKEEADRALRESLEGHRKAQELAEGGRGPATTSRRSRPPRTDLTGCSGARYWRDGGQDRAQENPKNNAGPSSAYSMKGTINEGTYPPARNNMVGRPRRRP